MHVASGHGLETLVGDWVGTKRLHLAPDAPVHVSDATARVALVARGGFLSIAYDWSFQGAPQDGVLLLRLGEPQGPLDMVWVDSGHTMGAFMTFRGATGASGRRSGSGTYAAPSGPDWGWRIVVEGGPEGELRMTMFNVPPGGTEVLAVDARFVRVPPGQPR
jgi:hypothetical protein